MSGYLAKSVNPGEQVVRGSFVVNGASAPTTVRGAGFTVSAPTTGVYTITLRKKYAAMLSCRVGLMQLANASAAVCMPPASQSPSTGVMVITTQSSLGTAADLSSSQEVHFEFVFRKTGGTR